MVLGASEVAGLALTSVGVAQLPVVAGAQATWERFTFDYHQKFLPLCARLEIANMHIQMLKRRAAVTYPLPMDFPGSVMTEKLDIANEVVTRAVSMCQEYTVLEVTARNSWGRNKGGELKTFIETGEQEMNLVLQYCTVRSQDMLVEVRDRLDRRSEEGVQQCGSSEIDETEEVEHCTVGDVSEAGDEPLGEGGNCLSMSEESVAATIVWVMLIAMSVTILVKVGQKI